MVANVNPSPGPYRYDFFMLVVLALAVTTIIFLLTGHSAFAAGNSLPGEDASDKLQAAGTLLRLIDTGLFKWGARIFSGICIMSAGWALKEQRFGIAVICVIGAIIFGTAPIWVKNIFDIGGGGGLFSAIEPQFLIALGKKGGGTGA
jgi:hypothetical protein